MVEVLIFWGGRLVARELYATLGRAVLRQIEMEPWGYTTQRRLLRLPTAAPAA